MKLTFSISKTFVEKGVITHVKVDELVAKDVAYFTIDDGKQQIEIHYNNEPVEIIELQKSEGDVQENWSLISIRCFKIPLKVQL